MTKQYVKPGALIEANAVLFTVSETGDKLENPELSDNCGFTALFDDGNEVFDPVDWDCSVEPPQLFYLNETEENVPEEDFHTLSPFMGNNVDVSAPNDIETYRVMAISSGHLTFEDTQLLDYKANHYAENMVMGRDTGFFMKLYEKDQCNDDDSYSESLKDIIRYAVTHGFRMIEFDCDAPVCELWPIHEDKTEVDDE
jgi:hypothetical protein